MQKTPGAYSTNFYTGRLRKVIWIPDEKLFGVFDLGVAIHGSEFVCFLDTFICY